MKRFFLFTLFLPFALAAQVNLLNNISTGQLPADSDSIAPFVPYIDSTNHFMFSGFHYQNLVSDFILFDTLSQPLQLSTLLSDGKPVLLASISITCPASRHCIADVLLPLDSAFHNSVNFVLVYTLDAHPIGPDYSPYSDTVSVLPSNYPDSALFRQPTTYLQRKQLAATFIRRYQPGVPVLIDGPGNEYWSTFGPAPNNAYLLKPDGTVYRKYGWLRLSKGSIMQDIPQLLNLLGTPEQTLADNVFVSPNPSNENAAVHVETTQPWSMTILDISGQVVATEEDIHSQEAALEDYHLAAGSYFIAVRTSVGMHMLRYVRN